MRDHMKGMTIRYRRAAAIVCAMAMCAASATSFAARPTPPGKPSASVGDQRVSLQWAESQDDNEVRGYNIYLNDDYMVTVFENRYAGFLDTSRENTFYVTAFDTPLPGDERAYSSRSEETVVARFDPNDSSPAIPTSPPSNPSGGTDTTAPSVPTGLTLISAVSNAIAIKWVPSTDNVGVIGYNVYRQGEYVKTVFSTRYVDINPLSGIANNYSVVAFDAAKNYTSRSAELSITAPGPSSQPGEPDIEPTTEDVTAPSIPDGLTVVLATQDAVRISWEPSTDNVAVDGYNVYLNDVYSATVFDISYVDLAPNPGVMHAYSVVAFDAARNYSSRSEAVVIKGAEEAPDPAPLLPKVPEPDATRSLQTDKLALQSNSLPRNPGPRRDDPFVSLLEIDREIAQAGGPPTVPKNLRADLVSNDWAAINWAPANDDVGVVAYNIYRSDGVTYTVSPDLIDTNDGSPSDMAGYWRTTSFIDCYFTLVDERVNSCVTNQPVPGETYVYRVSAVDEDGGESPLSQPLSITYHVPENAVIPMFEDFSKSPEDFFVQSRDLSQTQFFLDEFQRVFNDEFETVSEDPGKWQTALVWQESLIGNEEQRPAGCAEVDPLDVDRCGLLSAVLSSHERFSFVYGYVEGRMKMADMPGALSGFALQHNDKGSGVRPHAPVLDIVRYSGGNRDGADSVAQRYRFDDVNSGLRRASPTMFHQLSPGQLYSDEYHTFGLLWEPQLIVWYIDGREVRRLTGPMVPRQSMSLVNFLAVGSAGKAATSEIDYVRVYQRDVYLGTSSFGR
ncbi:MAG: family 16 glycosylhydrolase [Granulosicoccus sp.]